MFKLQELFARCLERKTTPFALLDAMMRQPTSSLFCGRLPKAKTIIRHTSS
jgi:hypothetical protein